MARATKEQQRHFEEELLQSEDLERQLERRQEIKDEIDRLKHGEDGESGYNELNKGVKATLKNLELDPEKVYRCGRFVIKPKKIEEQIVTFPQSASMRFDIEPAV